MQNKLIPKCKDYHFSDSIGGKTQADGAQTITVPDGRFFEDWQVTLALSSTPSSGAMTVSYRELIDGAAVWTDLPTTIDMVSGPLGVRFTALTDAIKLSPASYDATKTYGAHVAGS